MAYSIERQALLARPTVIRAIKLVEDGEAVMTPPQGLCASPDTKVHWWFPDKGRAYQGKEICDRCPVAAECLAAQCLWDRKMLNSKGVAGMFGGLTADQRRIILGDVAPVRTPWETNSDRLDREPELLEGSTDEGRRCVDCLNVFPATSRHFKIDNRTDDGHPAFQRVCRRCSHERYSHRWATEQVAA